VASAVLDSEAYPQDLAKNRRYTVLDEPALLVRVSVLAVGPYHIDSAIEVHRIGAVAAVDGVSAPVVVSVNHVVAGDRVVAPVTADAVCAASSREIVVAAAASYLVGTGGAYEGVGREMETSSRMMLRGSRAPSQHQSSI
jgi:hypothetical protein